MELVDVLKSSNLFCVGDPRQSIFGWRGSNIKYILGFAEKFFGSETIVLTKNYRSSSKIVDLMNAAISKLGLASLESCVAGSSDIKLEEFSNADEEFGFVVDSIAHATCSPSEIFVLARTNRQLNELSLMLKQRRIPHIVRSDEMKKPAVDSGGVTLATVHAIKGMEAEMVIVVGCTTSQFPCKASEHPVVEMVKVDTYDREEEERRLFYVALSRAKSKLYMTYTGKKPTHYLTEEMMLMVDSAAPKRSTKLSLSSSSDVVTKLKEWRTSLSSELGVPPYMVMHDKTLFDLAVKMPLDVRALENVIGLGPAKIAKYGEQILDVLIG
jgi:superfamily I DNA/RNA helicase